MSFDDEEDLRVAAAHDGIERLRARHAPLGTAKEIEGAKDHVVGGQRDRRRVREHPRELATRREAERGGSLATGDARIVHEQHAAQREEPPQTGNLGAGERVGRAHSRSSRETDRP